LLPLLPLWLLRGRAYLKRQLAQRLQIDPRTVPWNEEFVNFLRTENEAGRKLILISGSDEMALEAVARALPVFDELHGSNGETNLKGSAKVSKIRELIGDEPFAYAGNAKADIPVWRAATECLAVNCNSALVNDVRQMKGDNLAVQSFDRAPSRVPAFFTAMRPHQWLKNLLLFLPLILAHRLNELPLLLSCLFAFVSFSLCASSVYLLNDMLDLASDRLHVDKKHRPLASGDLPLEFGFAGAPALFLAALLLAWLIGYGFLGVLLLYWAMTSLYSLVLKRLFLFDVATLSLLYSLRLVAGAVAAGVAITDWLLAFSVFVFLGLALVKRVTELIRLRDEGLQDVSGRAYRIEHIGLLMTLGLMASTAAVLVFMFYISAPETTRLYESPGTLWLICPLLLGLLGRTWHFAWRGEITEDPIMLVARDKPSQAMLVLSLLILWWAI
jgi:4-hydroxybenzoate polyprenyltransferase